MPSVTITNLDNLPEHAALNFTTNVTRSGNTITYNNTRGPSYIQYHIPDTGTSFPDGVEAEIAFTLDDQPTNSRWMTLGFIGMNRAGSYSAVFTREWLILSGVEGTTGLPYAGTRTRTPGTIVARGRVYPHDELCGFAFYFGSANNDGSSGNSTFSVTLQYITTNFEPVDPYDPIGDSGPSGPGDGTFDFTSTDIPIPGLPNIGAMSTGFLNLYHPSAAQLRALAAYMWSGSFDPANMRKLFADPMDAILGLHIIPTIAGHPATSSSSLYVGNVDTGLSMPAVTEQYYSLDCGTVQIPPKWGAYLDYSPYSKLSLYLPYIGVVPISADDCMRGSIRVQYHVDVLSGTCVAFVYCVSNRGADGHTLYTFTGSCNCECPVTEGQYANALMAGMRVVSGIVSGAAGGVAGMVAGGVSEAANAAISMVKPDIGRSGGLGGSAGLMGIQYPYLILTVPRMAKPAAQNKYIGYPSFVTLTMGDCVGFTRIDVTHLEGIPATQGELEEIVGLLAEGVIF